MKTEEIIEMLDSWSNDCHVWFDFDGHEANAAILLREAAHKLRKNAVQEYEIEALKKLIGELRKELAEREAAPGWISVAERMPEKMGELCLVYRKSGDINLSVYFNHYWNYGDVTHWMPIPETPKKVKTYTDVYLDRMKEAFPEAVLDGSVTGKCRNKLFGINKHCTYQCRDCWNQPYPEEEGGAE